MIRRLRLWLARRLIATGYWVGGRAFDAATDAERREILAALARLRSGEWRSIPAPPRFVGGHFRCDPVEPPPPDRE